METDQEGKEIVEDSRKWYWSRMEHEETAVVAVCTGRIFASSSMAQLS